MTPINQEEQSTFIGGLIGFKNKQWKLDIRSEFKIMLLYLVVMQRPNPPFPQLCLTGQLLIMSIIIKELWSNG